VTWEEAIAYTARNSAVSVSVRTHRHRRHHTRCTNEETYLVQKLVRQGPQQNVDTCARVCHSPTGYGLGQTYGTSAGTQDFDSVDHTDVAVVIGANPATAHPVFASRLKKRLRQVAKLIVLYPRRTEMVKSAHVEADFHLPPKPALMWRREYWRVIVTEGLFNKLHPRALRLGEFQDWASLSPCRKTAETSAARQASISS
jgi:formate dehydrogenase major subunit